MSESNNGFNSWVIIELLGHRRLAGQLSEQQIAGTTFLRIDVPAGERGPEITQYYSASAVYSLTPCSEEVARSVAQHSRPAPLYHLGLPAPEPRYAYVADQHDDGEYEEYETEVTDET